MGTYVCLLRGVNVGGKRAMKMAELREVFVSLGFGDAKTFIQSGNVVFGAPRVPRPADIEAAIDRVFSSSVSVVLRSAAQLRRVVAANPFADGDPAFVHVGFLRARPPAASVRAVDPAAFEPERVAVVGSDVFFYLPNGMGRSNLPSQVERRLASPATIRNWRTVTSLAELAGAG